MQCAYRSKFCDAPRATKLDGTLHKLCDFHRRKANANQQRLHKRKKRVLMQQAAAAGVDLDAPRTPLRKRARHTVESPQSATAPIDGLTFQSRFDLVEVKILEVLLFDECAASRPPMPELSFKEELALGGPASPSTPSMAPVPVFDSAWSVTL
jgi:hypothetical protein